ncbi:MAG: hypothetical protein Q8867_07260 [Bacteroidota bacterium]|nr:hypothetical protein [Bacteroidota bacterium]
MMHNRKISSKTGFDLAFFTLLLVIGILLGWNINFINRSGPGPIYADKAAYYVYLPATFIYGWDVNKFPKGIDEKTKGFTLHYPDNKLIIKTTYGVALMVSPFFLVTHAIAVKQNLQPDGFSDIYEKMTVFPAVFYLILGMFFLKKFLDNYFRKQIPYLVVILIVAGTNLYYYGFRDGLMSHVYSFFLFSLYLFLLKKFLSGDKNSFTVFLLVSITLSLAVLIRPTNILLLIWAFCLDVRSREDIRERFRLFFRFRYIAAFLLIFFIIYLPQLLYWKYLSGNFFYYSYPGESFSAWKDPQIIPLWFAPLNGLFLYSPLVFCFIAGIIYMIVKKIPNGIFIGCFFLLISYLFASWHIWFFGGSMGSRPFTEYYSLLAFPFAVFIEKTGKIKNRFIRSMVVLFIFFSSFYSLKLVYHYDWNTSSVWSWDDYLKRLDFAGLYVWPGETYTYKNDFENYECAKTIPCEENVHSGSKAGFVDGGMIFTEKFYQPLKLILKKPVRKVSLQFWINPGSNPETGAIYVCSIENWKGEVHDYHFVKADHFIKKPNVWSKVDTTFTIPEWVPAGDMVSSYLWNFKGRKQRIYIDDIVMKFK